MKIQSRVNVALMSSPQTSDIMTHVLYLRLKIVLKMFFPLLFTRLIPFFLHYFFFAEMERYILTSRFITSLTANSTQPSYKGLRKRPNFFRTYYPDPAIPFLPGNLKQFRKPNSSKSSHNLPRRTTPTPPLYSQQGITQNWVRMSVSCSSRKGGDEVLWEPGLEGRGVERAPAVHGSCRRISVLWT